MKSIVSNQPPMSFEADREHDQSQNGWMEPRTSGTVRHRRVLTVSIYKIRGHFKNVCPDMLM